MRISFAPSESGMLSFRTTVDSVGGRIGRVWISEDDRNYPGQVWDVMIRYSNYDEGSDSVIVQRWDREANQQLTSDVIVTVDRIHMY